MGLIRGLTGQAVPTGPTGYVEADGVLDVALACREAFLNAGYEVVMTRETDKSLTVSQRAGA